MACLTEFQCAVYADGELPEGEARHVDRHLAACESCRRLFESLRVENRVLVHCLRDIEFIEFELEDETLTAPQAETLGITKFAAFVLAMSVLLRPVFTALGELRLPLSASAQFNLFVDAVMYGIPAALHFINSFLKVTSWVVAGCIVGFGVFILVRRSPIISTLVSILTLLTIVSPSTFAIDVRRGERPVTVPAGETIDDTLVVVGDSVSVDGTINGDLIAFVRDVRVQGTIKGNLITFAERTEVDGAIEASIWGAGGFLEMRGQAVRNLYALAASVNIGRQSRIDGNATMLVGESTLEGHVAKDFTAYTARSFGWGPHTVFNQGGVVHVMAPAHIGGNFFAGVDKDDNAAVDTGAFVGGKREIRITPPSPSRYATASFYVWQTIWLVAALLTGLIFFRLVPDFAHIGLVTGHELLLTSGVGFLALIGPPIAAFIAGLTLVGLPLGLLTFGLWMTAAYLAKIVIAAFIGRSLLSGSGDTPPATPLILLSGLLAVFIAINLPYVGGVINLLLIVLGLGLLVIRTYQMPRWRPSSNMTPLTA